MATTYDKALQIAERHIREQLKVSEFLSRYEFGEVGLRSENERFWTFASGSEELFDQGIVPGAIYACVDKENGRVWSNEDVEQFYLQKAASRQARQHLVAAD